MSYNIYESRTDTTYTNSYVMGHNVHESRTHIVSCKNGHADHKATIYTSHEWIQCTQTRMSWATMYTSHELIYQAPQCLRVTNGYNVHEAQTHVSWPTMHTSHEQISHKATMHTSHKRIQCTRVTNSYIMSYIVFESRYHVYESRTNMPWATMYTRHELMCQAPQCVRDTNGYNVHESKTLTRQASQCIRVTEWCIQVTN